MNFCFELLQELPIVWEAISNTRKNVSSYCQTPRSWFKKLGYASYFSVFANRRKHSPSCLIYYFKFFPPIRQYFGIIFHWSLDLTRCHGSNIFVWRVCFFAINHFTLVTSIILIRVSLSVWFLLSFWGVWEIENGRMVEPSWQMWRVTFHLIS